VGYDENDYGPLDYDAGVVISVALNKTSGANGGDTTRIDIPYHDDGPRAEFSLITASADATGFCVIGFSEVLPAATAGWTTGDSTYVRGIVLRWASAQPYPIDTPYVPCPAGVRSLYFRTDIASPNSVTVVLHFRRCRSGYPAMTLSTPVDDTPAPRQRAQAARDASRLARNQGGYGEDR